VIFNKDIVDGVFNKLSTKDFMNTKNLKLSKIIIKPNTISPNTTLVKAREILLENKIKRVIVVDKRKPVGIVTEKDIAKKIYGLGTKSIKSVKAKEFKLKKIFTLTRNNSIQECAKMMKKYGISSIIILNEDNTLEGIVTKTSLVKIFLTTETIPIKVSKIMKKK